MMEMMGACDRCGRAAKSLAATQLNVSYGDVKAVITKGAGDIICKHCILKQLRDEHAGRLSFCTASTLAGSLSAPEDK